jgi:hypothetical protein
MRRCPDISIHQGMQIKSTLRYHLMPVRISIIKKMGVFSKMAARGRKQKTYLLK